jgi:hypothetical protein
MSHDADKRDNEYLSKQVEQLIDERDRYREALEQIADDSPNWMVADAVAECLKRVQASARAAVGGDPE